MAASNNAQMGGAFDPTRDVNFSGAVDFATAPTNGSATFVNTTGAQTLTNKTLTSPTVTAPSISGGATIASGATITTPTMSWTSANVTSTGTGATDATALSAVYPQFAVVSTGATGSGVSLPSAAAVTGALYIISNQVAATLRIYSSGATINGTTGTTAFTLTNTGNKQVTIMCAVAGAWIASGNT